MDCEYCELVIEPLLPMLPKHCDNTAPTPVSDATTSTMNHLSGSGCFSIGMEVKVLLSSRETTLVHIICFVLPFSGKVDGAAIILKFQMNLR